MKKEKIIYLVLCLLVLISLTGCFNKNETSSDNEQKKEISPKEAYFEVLSNKRTFTDEDNQNIKIDSYYDILINTTTPSKYALLDMDRDNEEELVVSLGDMYFLILNYEKEDDIVYGFQEVIRGLEGLRENGYYISSGGATYNFLNCSTFTKNKRLETEIASEQVDSNTSLYKINGQEVTSSEYQKFIKENYTAQKEPDWIEYDILSNIQIDGEAASLENGTYTSYDPDSYNSTITISDGNITLKEGDIDITKYGTYIIKSDKLIVTYTSEIVYSKELEISEQTVYTINDNNILDKSSNRTFTK